ncbi:MAG: hypothetical protein FJ284_15735 [Planctomycetes bacterium]|nr:hypothetical protein [Planctomycetota bacterium]
MKLVTLQVLASLSAGMQGGRGRASGGDTFEDYAYGLFGRVGAGSDGDGGPEGLGLRGGSAALSRVQAAIRRDPMKWVDHFNQYLRRELGAEETGAGWSAAEYGRRRIEWSNRADLEHAFMLMAEIHRLLGRREHALAEAFCCQALKAIEQTSLDRGDWSLGWAYTGLAELKSTSRARRGGAHPIELAAGMSFLKELKTVEEWRASGRKGPKGSGGGSTTPP